METIHHYVGGESVPSRSGRVHPIFNPATGEQTAEVGLASVEEVDAAVASAAAAFEEWRHTSLAARTKLMHAFRNLVEANATEIAARLTAEHGKVQSDALGEVARGLENIEFACGLGDLLKGSYNSQASGGVDVYTVRQPLGVVAGITPFNFPAMVPLWMIPNALACGNTFVLKPSERDPSAPRLVAELAFEAGFPPGVLNVVKGDKVAVDRLLTHPDGRRGELRGVHPDRPLRVRDGHLGRQAGAGPRGGQEPHGGAARRRPGPRGRRGRVRRLRLGRGAVHGGVGGGGRGRRRRSAGGRHQGAHGQAPHRARRRPRLRDGPAHHPRAPRPGGGLRGRRRGGGRHCGSGRTGVGLRGRRILPGRVAARQRQPPT